MKRSVVLVSIVFLMLAGVVARAEEASPAPAAVTPAAAPVAAPKPPAPAAPAAVPKPAAAEKEKPAAAQPPASSPAEPERSGDMPLGREAKTVAGPAVVTDGLAGYLWPAFSFAMLIAGFAAGYFWRHHVSRQKLGGMTVRIGTWRGTP